MFGSTNTKLGSGGPSYGYIMAEYPEGSQCQITRELDEKILKARGTGGNWAFALPEVIGLKVPKEYQEVEYLQVPSGAYIKTGLTQKDTYSFTLDFALLNSLPSSHFLGIYDTYGINVRVPGGQSYIAVRYGSNSSYGSITGITLGTKYRLELENKKYYFNGTQVYDGSANTITANSNIQNYLCGASDSSGGLNATSNGMRVYYCEWADNGITVRQFIPCYRKSDSVAGLFDTITNTFFTNAGTGTFTVGPDTGGDEWAAYCTDGENEAENKVNILYNGDIKSTKLYYRVPKEYQAIEYLQNSTNAYYDTGIIPITTNYTTEVKFQVAITNGAQLLGVEGGYYINKPNSYDQFYYGYIDSSAYFSVNGLSTVGTNFDLIYNATGGQILLNGEVKATNANIRAKSDRQYSILIGASRYGASVQNYGTWRYKEVIISERDTGNKLAELFPCYRKSDNVVGFWDTVGQKFLTHLGTGTVIAGPDI